jgi:BlaI family penicillinase repressor
MKSHARLSRRERQIMDVLYMKGKATAGDVMEALPEAPGYSAVRTLLRILEEKGHIRHEKAGPKYVFIPTVHREKARQSALRHLIQTFFGGSPSQAAVALLDLSVTEIPEAEIRRLTRLIEKNSETKP